MIHHAHITVVSNTLRFIAKILPMQSW